MVGGVGRLAGGWLDQGYGRAGTPVFTGVFEPVARVTPYLTDENGLGTCFGAAFRLPLHCGLISST